MDEAAKEYVRALNDRNSTRKNPPHDVFVLQNRVRNYASRILTSRNAVRKVVDKRYGPTRSKVTRPVPEGIYKIGDRLVVRRGDDAPSVKFWNMGDDKSYYLKRDGRDWSVRYGPDAGNAVQLDEYWTPSGLR